MPIDLSSAAAIVGFGDAYASEDDVKTPIELAVEATTKALADAGLGKEYLDGVVTGRAPLADQRPQWNNIFSSYMQLTPELSTEVTSHGAGSNGTLGYAAMAVATGVVDYCLCLQSDAAPLFTDPVYDVPTLDADGDLEYPYGPSTPSVYALSATRYMHEHGVSDEVLAQVAVGHQRWAVHHPYAAKGGKGEITVADVLSSRMIADPIRLWNAAIWGPGGTAGAVIVTTPDRAAALTDDPIHIRGFGFCNTHEYVTDRANLTEAPIELGDLPNLTRSGARRATEKAYRMAGVGPSDIGLIECGSNFTHIPMILLEDFGFCEHGRAKDLVMSGRLEPGGDLPLNTNGGWLSFGQPGISCAMDPIVEAIRQLRGEALGLQVEDPKIALTHGLGGMMACHSVALLSR